MHADLVDKIYESCFIPGIWASVLEEIRHLVNASGASLVVFDGGRRRWVAASDSRERIGRMIREHWPERGSVIPRLFAAQHCGFVTDLDLFTRDELEEEPFYRDFLRPTGVSWAMATVIPFPTGEKAMFTLARPAEPGPFDRAAADRLDALRPHLARGVLMSARLQHEQARVVSETLAMMGLPALVFDDRGVVLAANALIEASGGAIGWRAFDRVALKDKAAEALWRQAIAMIDTEGATVRSFPIHDIDADKVLVAHVIPVRLSARDVFVRASGVLTLTPVTAPEAPPVELVQSLFDLTPAEARVARQLAAGRTVETIAADGGVSMTTVRTHVRGVLEKTGCHRQSEVVALLNGITPPRVLARR